MAAEFNSWLFVVISSHDPLVLPQTHPRRAGQRSVLMFLSEETSSAPLHLLDRYDVVFKSYLPADAVCPRLYPLALGCVSDVPMPAFVPFDQRVIDVFFAGNLNINRIPLYCAFHPFFCMLPQWVAYPLIRLLMKVARAGLPDRLRLPGPHRFFLYFSRAFKSGLPPAEYAALLAQSRIVLCPPGFYSSETFRHMEALRSGAVVVSAPLPSHCLYASSPIQQFDHFHAWRREIARLLDQPDHLHLLHRQSLQWWDTVLSPAATARLIHHRLHTLGC